MVTDREFILNRQERQRRVDRYSYLIWLEHLVIQLRSGPEIEGTCEDKDCDEPVLAGIGCMKKAYRSLSVYRTLVKPKNPGEVWVEEWPYEKWKEVQLAICKRKEMERGG